MDTGMTPRRPTLCPPSRSSVGAADEPRVRLPVRLIIVLLAWLAVQDLVLASTLRIGPASALAPAVALKELITVVLFVLLLFGRRPDEHRIGGIGLLAVAWGIIVVVYSLAGLTGGAATGAVAASARSALMPIGLLLVGRLVQPSRHELSLILQAFMGVFIASALFGFIERFMLDERFWVSVVGLPDYLQEVKGVSLGLRPEVGLPWNFWWGDQAGTIRRLAGLSASPLGLGYALLAPVAIGVAGVFYGVRPLLTGSWLLPLTILATALVLTITRMAMFGAAVAVAVILVALFLQSRHTRGRRSALLMVVVIGVVSLLASLTLASDAVTRIWSATLSLSDTSSAYRLPLLEESWRNVQDRLLVGAGAGTAGSWAQTIGGSTPTAESAYLAIIYQVGLAGLLIFLANWAMATLAALQVVDEYRYARVAIVGTSVGFAITGLLSEQILAVTSTGSYWLLLGMLSVPSFPDRTRQTRAHARPRGDLRARPSTQTAA